MTHLKLKQLRAKHFFFVCVDYFRDTPSYPLISHFCRVSTLISRLICLSCLVIAVEENVTLMFVSLQKTITQEVISSVRAIMSHQQSPIKVMNNIMPL